jgi:hypothetical protein
MTLATHAVVGAAVAQLFPQHPIIAFSAAFLSHFLLDAIPHWDYKILSVYANPDIAMAQNNDFPGDSRSTVMDRNFLLDLMRIGSDALLGLVAVLVLVFLGFFPNLWIVLLGAGAAILPDFLQFVYMRFPYQPIVALQNFHHWIHAESRPFKESPVLGIITQIAVVGICLMLFNSLFV